ncbi:MAG: hypothetical protein ACWA5K_02895, partial [bacterium]
MTDQESPQMNPNELYLEENFTDQKMGSIRKLTPVTASGDVDSARDIIFIGSASVMSPMGAIPINFQLDAKTIGEAAEKFGEEAEKAVERTAQELEKLRREQQSQIVVPGRG